MEQHSVRQQEITKKKENESGADHCVSGFSLQ